MACGRGVWAWSVLVWGDGGIYGRGRGGFYWWWRIRRARRRATCTNWRRCGRGASVRRRRGVAWAWACVFYRRLRTSLFLRRGRGWGGHRGGRGGRSRTFQRSRRRCRGRRRGVRRVLRRRVSRLARARGRCHRWFFARDLSWRGFLRRRDRLCAGRVFAALAFLAEWAHGLWRLGL